MDTLTQIDNRAVCEETLAILSSHFGIEKPKLDWSSNSFGASTASPMQNRIKIVSREESRTRLNNSNVLLHEFSHILTHHKYVKNLSFNQKYKISPFGRYTKVVRSHGKEFMDTLLEVVMVWYGDPDKYEWKKDYRSIAKWYLKRKA